MFWVRDKHTGTNTNPSHTPKWTRTHAHAQTDNVHNIMFLLSCPLVASVCEVVVCVFAKCLI